MALKDEFKLPAYFSFGDFYHSPGDIDIDFVIPETKKKSVILFGCSYTAGMSLSPNENFSSVLSRTTNRSVYNFGLAGHGVGTMPIILNNPKFFKEYSEPEYVIYTLMFDHITRVSPEHLILYNQYKTPNKIWAFFKNSPTLRNCQMKKADSYEQRNYFSKFFMLESVKLIKKHWKNTKFVLLIYEDIDKPEDIKWEAYAEIGKRAQRERFEFLQPENWKELEKDGIIVISTRDLAGSIAGKQAWQLNDSQMHYFGIGHPSAYAWEQIVPRLARS